ncbi:MAG: tRNA uridine-5-carboxymethylaminomethyl(34) synthesis enzyme MnmG, partial [Ruthenibacterium sp.]
KQAEIERLSVTNVRPTDANPILLAAGEQVLTSGATAADLLRRPPVKYAEIAPIIGINHEITPFIAYCIETEIKYAGYIKRQQIQINAVKRQEEAVIPPAFDYAPLTGLRLEAREKLAKIRPISLGQAARIPGVGPADIACLAVALAKERGKHKEKQDD